MMGKSYLSFSATVILQAVANGYQYGFDIMDMTGLPGGTVYPALRRLEDMGYVLSKWEKHEIAQRELRPPRKYYEVTDVGALAMQPRRLEEEMFQDLRYGARMLLQSKGWTAVAVLSLALGIGANTALFSVVDRELFRTLPVKNPEQLVRLMWVSGPNHSRLL